MIDRTLNFFVPRDRAHFVRLILVLIGLVYVTTLVVAYVIYWTFYPEWLRFIGIRYAITTLPICAIVTLPYGFLLLTIGMQMRDANERLKKISETDSLTGLPNRGTFISGARDHIQTSAEPGALLLIDADDFKQLNDTHGHQTGDLALMVIAMHLKDCIREGDLVGRIGGEEFGVFLPGATGEQAEIIAERIRSQIAEDVIQTHDEAAELSFSVSVGGVHVPRPVSFDQCFRVADQSLYAAKAAGRNQVVFSRCEIGISAAVQAI